MKQDGAVIWITGLSGSGKTSTATNLVNKIRSRGGAPILLDGDELREALGVAQNSAKHHGRAARVDLAFRYSKLCKLLAGQGHVVVIATISMFKEVHLWNRQNIEGYMEVYLKVEIDELRRRDPKGLYKLHEEGRTKNIAGIDLPVDEPESPDLRIISSEVSSPEECANVILTHMMAAADESR